MQQLAQAPECVARTSAMSSISRSIGYFSGHAEVIILSGASDRVSTETGAEL